MKIPNKEMILCMGGEYIAGVHLEQMESYIPFSLTDPVNMAWAALALMLVVVLRYVVVCGAVEVLFYRWAPPSLKRRRVVDTHPSAKERFFEFRQSILASLIFAVVGVLMGWMWQQGYARFYLAFDEYGYAYLFLSLSLIHI